MTKFRRHEPFKIGDQYRQVFLHGLPDDIEVDAEIRTSRFRIATILVQGMSANSMRVGSVI